MVLVREADDSRDLIKGDLSVGLAPMEAVIAIPFSIHNIAVRYGLQLTRCER